MSQVWTAPAVHLPSLSGPGVCQAGPERQRAPVPPPSQSEPSEVSDWAAVSRRKWTRQQAVRILQPGVEWCHRPSSHLAQAQGLATGSAPPAPPAHPGGETGCDSRLGISLPRSGDRETSFHESLASEVSREAGEDKCKKRVWVSRSLQTKLGYGCWTAFPWSRRRWCLCRASRIMAEVTSRTSTRNRAKLKLGQAC